MNIYVGNFGYDLSEEDLTAAFRSHGEVESARIITDRDTGRSKGFGFVEMAEKEEGMSAIEALNGTELAGRTITVNEARPKVPRHDRNSGFGGGGRNRF
ncbi:MAG: RNA recognition motif domain-containing protein [bacterium]